MPDKKISQLPAAGALDGTEAVPVDQVSVTVQTTTGDIAALAGGGGGGFWEYDGSTLQPDPATTTPLDAFHVGVGTDPFGLIDVLVGGLAIVGGNSAIDGDAGFTFNATTGGPAALLQREMALINSDPGNERAFIVDQVQGPGGTMAMTLHSGNDYSAVSLGVGFPDDPNTLTIRNGSFSLQADDGTYAESVVGSSGTVGVSAVDDATPTQFGSLFATTSTTFTTTEMEAQRATRSAVATCLSRDDDAFSQVTLAASGPDNFAAFSVFSMDGRESLARFSGLVATPNDSDLSESEFAFWLDDTPGATKLMVKAKDSGGTVRTTAIALT